MPFGPIGLTNKRKDLPLPQKIEMKVGGEVIETVGGPETKRRRQDHEGFRDGEHMESGEGDDDSKGRVAYQLAQEGYGSCLLLGEESGSQSAGVKSSAYAWGVCSIQVRNYREHEHSM
jgi:hypothetical protein